MTSLTNTANGCRTPRWLEKVGDLAPGHAVRSGAEKRPQNPSGGRQDPRSPRSVPRSPRRAPQRPPAAGTRREGAAAPPAPPQRLRGGSGGGGTEVGVTSHGGWGRGQHCGDGKFSAPPPARSGTFCGANGRGPASRLTPHPPPPPPGRVEPGAVSGLAPRERPRPGEGKGGGVEGVPPAVLCGAGARSDAAWGAPLTGISALPPYRKHRPRSKRRPGFASRCPHAADPRGPGREGKGRVGPGRVEPGRSGGGAVRCRRAAPPR